MKPFPCPTRTTNNYGIVIRGVSIILLLVNMVLLSCISEEEPVTVQQSDTSPALQEARTWFGAEEEFVVSENLLQSSRTNRQIKKLHWDESLVHTGSNVIEVELDYNYHSVPTNGEKSTEEIREKQKNSFYRMILIPDENGEYSGAILKFFPDKGITDQDNILLNNYSTISPEYSGKVELYTWDEKLIKGWRIKNGEVIKYITPVKQLNGKRNNGSIQSRGGCTTYTESDCITYQGVTDCYDNIPVVECNEDQAGDEYADGGGSSRPTFSSTKWHGFSPEFSTGTNYYKSSAYWNGVYATLMEYSIQANPGVKDYSTMNATQRFLHILSHIKISKKNKQNLNITKIFKNLPKYASRGPFTPPGGWYESGHAYLKINGEKHVIGFVYGIENGYNYINLKISPQEKFIYDKNQLNYYFKEVNYPGRTALEVHVPLKLKGTFRSIFY